MKRLVIGVTGLLAVAGIVVLVGYLLVFSASPDRAARAVPAAVVVYVNFYLEPSTGQRMNLYGLIGRLPGFADPATLEQKIHDVAQRLIGQIGIDYAADIRPWLGDQVALAIVAGGGSDGGPQTLLLAALAEPESAAPAVERIMTRDGTQFESATHRGVTLHVATAISYALLDDLLVVGSGAGVVREAIDAEAGAAPSLADSADFGAALRRVPADHIGSIYVDLRPLLWAGETEPVGGYTTVSVALVADGAGVRLAGDAPFTGSSPQNREAFALASEASSLADWMPADAQAEAIVFGIQQALAALEEQIADRRDMQDVVEALNQLRALAAIGLGINVDRDLLPLLDREVGVALHGRAGGSMIQLLLRPSDPGAAADALERMRDALVHRGSRVATSMAAGVEVTTLVVPEIGQIAYARSDDVVIMAFEPGAVAAVLQARASGLTLAQTDRYLDAFTVLGTRRGHELWIDVAGSSGVAGEMLQIDEETRGILLRLGAFALSAAAHDNQLEIRAILTVK